MFILHWAPQMMQPVLSVGLEWSCRIGIAKKFPGETDAVSQGFTLHNHSMRSCRHKEQRKGTRGNGSLPPPLSPLLHQIQSEILKQRNKCCGNFNFAIVIIVCFILCCFHQTKHSHGAYCLFTSPPPPTTNVGIISPTYTSVQKFFEAA